MEFLSTTTCSAIAEIGVEWGSTSEEILRVLDGRGELHLFDFQDRLDIVAKSLNTKGLTNFVPHSNSRRTLDSYNWQLMRLIDSDVRFDYVFIDGAHTWAIDALAFFLSDILLKAGGYLDFDDYDWTLAGSPTVNPKVFPAIKKLYTDEQMEASQVKLIVDLLVRRSGRYEEIVENKIFRKAR